MKNAYAMKRFAALSAALLPFTALGGCASLGSLQAQSRVNPVTMAAYPVKPTDACPLVRGGTSDTRVGAIDLDCFRFPEQNPSQDRATLAYSMATRSEIDRNRLTSILLKQSDDVCTNELGRLTADEAITNTSMSILSTGLSAAATIVTGELANSILAGAAGFVGASRDHINVHVYRNTIAQAVSQVIAAERKRINDDIRKNYTAKRDTWSIDDAIRAVNQYHGQCSFYKGLELLLKAADNNTDLAAYRNARAAQSRLTRLDQEITSLRAEANRKGANKEAMEKRLSDLILERSNIRTSAEDVPPDPADTNSGNEPAGPPKKGGDK